MSKAITILLGICLSGQILQAQIVQFDENGKLTKMSLLSSSNNLVDFDVALLNDNSNEAKKTARDLLINKIDETLKIILSSYYKRSLNHFYNLLWTTSERTNIIDYLKALREYLKNGTISLPIPPLAAAFQTPFNNNLKQGGTNIYSTDFDAKNPTSLTLKKTNPFKQFVIDYYNTTVTSLTDGTVTLSTDLFPNYLNYLEDQLSMVKKHLLHYRKHNQFDTAYYQTVQQFRASLTDSSSMFTYLTDQLKKPWFTQWFWFRGGEIRFNPLDFLTETYIRRNPSFDTKKSWKFNQYIDSIIDRQIRYDSVGHINAFIEKLKFQGAGNSIFSLASLTDSLTKANEIQRKEFLSSKQVLNKVEIPTSGDFFNFSAIRSISLDIDNKSLTTALHTHEQKTVVIHNIANGTSGGILQANKEIVDHSAFQEGLDSVISQLGGIAALVLKFSPFANMLDVIAPITRPPNNNIATIKIAPPPAAWVLESSPLAIDLNTIRITYYRSTDTSLIKNALTKVLKSINSYDPSLFNSKFETLNNVSLRTLNSSEMNTLKSNYRTKLDEYFQALLSKQITDLQNDSVKVSGIVDVLNYSTFPDYNHLEPEKPGKPVYTSSILKTELSNAAIEKTVTVYSAFKADTTQIAKFKYKVGKNHRFKLGAGVTYTFSSYNQSIAKNEGGTINIINHIRQYRFLVGLHTYLGDGLFMQDNSFWGKGKERNFVFVGVGIPQPLENIYMGLGRDLYPNLKFTLGLHLAKYNHYKIQNNAILEERLRYQLAGPFVALNFDPTSLLNLLNAFKD